MLTLYFFIYLFFFSSRRRHTRLQGDWSSDVCSSDLADENAAAVAGKKAGEVFGLAICAENIEDDPNNTTRFLVIGAQEVAPSRSEERRVGKECRSQWWRTQ